MKLKDVMSAVLACTGFLILALGYEIYRYTVETEAESARLEDEKSASEARNRAILAAKLESDRDGIITSIKQKISDGEFELAAEDANSFASFEDAEIMALAREAQDKQRAQEERELVAKVRAIPSSDLEGNISAYSLLVKIAPENAGYREKLEGYQARLDAVVKKAAEEYEALIAAYGPMPLNAHMRSGPVMKYLKRSAHDPDSIKIEVCTDVRLSDDAWIVGCKFRGKNGFGGTVLNFNWFSIRNGTVVQVHELDAYKI